MNQQHRHNAQRVARNVPSPLVPRQALMPLAAYPSACAYAHPRTRMCSVSLSCTQLLLIFLILTFLGLAGCTGGDTGCADQDGDGYYAGSACQMSLQEALVCDQNSAQHPNLPEVCDDIDNDCNGQVDEDEAAFLVQYRDQDQDGAGNPTSVAQNCRLQPGYVFTPSDCNDRDPLIHPGAIERCDGIDNNCDGIVDEGAEPLEQYRDLDGDGYGDTQSMLSACSLLDGYVLLSGDCDDSEANSYPEALELCDGADNNCNGLKDDGLSDQLWYRDQDGDGAGAAESGINSCQRQGYVLIGGDCNDTNPLVYPGMAEQCNGIDDDCNGLTDEGFTKTSFYRDQDQDGYGFAELATVGCSRPYGYVTNSTDCNDQNAAVHPGMTESCNNQDDNCDGLKDEGILMVTLYPDGDRDGYGVTEQGVQTCLNNTGLFSLTGGDCNDADSGIHPNAPELCNDVDDDCDRQTDEGVTLLLYYDADGDGFGTNTNIKQGCVASSQWVTQGGDCVDSDPVISPRAVELCNQVDDNCSNTIDEGLPLIQWYYDSDGDGYGRTNTTTQSCSQPTGFVANTGDCDDANANVSPQSAEACNARDDNCNGVIDEGLATQTVYADADGDGYGNAAQPTMACASQSGTVSSAGDCNDTSTSTHPGATERCDGFDNDCDGLTDEGLDVTYYFDSDGDGYGVSTITQRACSSPGGDWALVSGDCNDASASINPAQGELADAIDNDCDGQVDEYTSLILVSEPAQDIFRDPQEFDQPISFRCQSGCVLPLDLAFIASEPEVGEPLEVRSMSTSGGVLNLEIYVPRGAALGYYDLSYIDPLTGQKRELQRVLNVNRGDVAIVSVTPARFEVGQPGDEDFTVAGWNLDVSEEGPTVRLFGNPSQTADCDVTPGNTETTLSCTVGSTQGLTTGEYSLEIREHSSLTWDCGLSLQACYPGLQGVN